MFCNVVDRFDSGRICRGITPTHVHRSAHTHPLTIYIPTGDDDVYLLNVRCKYVIIVVSNIIIGNGIPNRADERKMFYHSGGDCCDRRCPSGIGQVIRCHRITRCIRSRNVCVHILL